VGRTPSATAPRKTVPTKRGGAPLPQLYMVGDYSHYDSLWPSDVVAKAPEPSHLHRSADETTLSYP
jgi:hypothetical protein